MSIQIEKGKFIFYPHDIIEMDGEPVYEVYVDKNKVYPSYVFKYLKGNTKTILKYEEQEEYSDGVYSIATEIYFSTDDDVGNYILFPYVSGTGSDPDDFFGLFIVSNCKDPNITCKTTYQRMSNYTSYSYTSLKKVAGDKAIIMNSLGATISFGYYLTGKKEHANGRYSIGANYLYGLNYTDNGQKRSLELPTYIPNANIIKYGIENTKNGIYYLTQLYESGQYGDVQYEKHIEIFKKNFRAMFGKITPSEWFDKLLGGNGTFYS